MWLPVAMLVGGVLVGLIFGGRWRAVLTTPVRLWPIGVLGIACSVLPWIGDQASTTALVGIGWALLIVFAVANLRLTGMAIVAIGLMCNLAVLVANRAMPVRADAAVRAGLASDDTVASTELGPGRRLAEPDDRLEPLSAIVPIPALGMVVTFGDLIALAGLADVGFRLARRRPSLHSAAHAHVPGRTHAARARRKAAPLPAWAQPADQGNPDDWVLDLRDSVLDAHEGAPALASLAPDDEPPTFTVQYSNEPLPSRH